MDRPPPPPAPQYSDGSGQGSGERRQLYTTHPGVGTSATGRHRGGSGGSSDFIFVEPEPRNGGYNAAYTGASHTSSLSDVSDGYGVYPDSGASSGGFGRTPMDDITPCGGPKMMVRPGKPDKPAKSKRTLHMETPSRQQGSSGDLREDGRIVASFRSGGAGGGGGGRAGGLQIFDESTRSPWPTNRVDQQLSCMINEKVRIHSPAQLSMQSLQVVAASTDTTHTIFGSSRPSKRASKAPPPPLWTEKENSVNDEIGRRSGRSGRGGRGEILRQSSSSSGEDGGSFSSVRSSGEGSLGGSGEQRLRNHHGMDICGDDEEEEEYDRTPSGKSSGGRGDDSLRRRKRTRTESEVSGGSQHSNTPDAQEEGYRRDRRRSSSINTLMHALGVEIGEDDLMRPKNISSSRGGSSRGGGSSRHSSRNSTQGGGGGGSRRSRRRPKSHSSDGYPAGYDETLSRALCSKIVGRMKRHGIRLLALDWDLTVLDCHTKNKWWGPAEELAKHIRPLFKHLMEQALATEISVAIVTFSEQTSFIRDALNHSIEGGEGIIVRGGDGSWDSSEIFDHYFDRDMVATDEEDPGHNAYGKLPHLASSMREIERRNGGVAIEKDDILLVDDDNHNIMIAGAQRLKTVRFREGDVNRAFGEMGEMFSRTSSDSPRNNFGSPAPKSLVGGGGSMTGSDGSPSGTGPSRGGRVRSRTSSSLRSVSSQLSKK